MKVDEIYHSYMYSYPHKSAYRPLKDIPLEDYKKALYGQENSLYIHIPFCQTKCGYCNLFSIAEKNQEYYDRYLDAVEDHGRQLNLKGVVWSSFILGGGTPMILNEKQLERLFFMGEREMSLDLKETYSCVETAPNQTDSAKLKVLKDFHVNRVSIGVQSFCQQELTLLKRHHTPMAALRALEWIKKEDFDCFNIDLIYGIPGQTAQILEENIKKTLEFEPDEIFAYPLYIRENANLKDYEPNRDTWNLYCYLRERLLASGYSQISMRRFVKASDIILQEESGCGFENTISLGCGGRSYLGNLHFCSKYETKPQQCREQIENYMNLRDKTVADYGILLDKNEQKRRYVIKNLLHYRGIDIKEYSEHFKKTLYEDFTIFKDFTSKGWCAQDRGRIRLTPLGLSLSDHIGPMFISDGIKNQMKGCF